MGLIRTTRTDLDDIIDAEAENEFEILPHMARIALAARIARRTVESFGTRWPEVPRHGSDKYLQAIKQIEDHAAFGEPVAEIETLQNELIMSLGAVRRSVYGRDDDVSPTEAEEAFVHQTDEATRIVERALEITQSSPSESAGILRIIYHRFMLLFNETDSEFCDSVMDDIEKICAYSVIEMWDDQTLVAPQIFNRDLPKFSDHKSGIEKLFGLIDSAISSRWFYGCFFIVLAYFSQRAIESKPRDIVWYGITAFNLAWVTLGILIMVRSRWAVGVYLFSAGLLGVYAVYFGLTDAFTTNRIILLGMSLFLIYRYQDVVEAVQQKTV